jgi:peptide alpha-N-acetyltransferase
MAQPTQPLPSKESGLFRQVVKFYESKQYKKAIKAADQILKKFPEHGETLAMKVCSGRLAVAAAAVLQATWQDYS